MLLPIQATYNGGLHCYGTDYRWWKHHISAITQDFEGRCWTQEVQWPENERPEQWGITCLKADTTAGGLSRDPGKVHTGRNSGYAAINLAYNLGAERILLLGYDMQTDGGRRHWFGAHPAGMEVASDYGSFMSRFETIIPSSYGIEIWNVTRRTAMTCFPRYDLDEIVEALSDTD